MPLCELNRYFLSKFLALCIEIDKKLFYTPIRLLERFQHVKTIKGVYL